MTVVHMQPQTSFSNPLSSLSQTFIRYSRHQCTRRIQGTTIDKICFTYLYKHVICDSRARSSKTFKREQPVSASRVVGLGYICYITFCHAVERFGSRRGGTRRAELLAAELTSRSSLAGMPSPERTHARPCRPPSLRCTQLQTLKSGTLHAIT